MGSRSMGSRSTNPSIRERIDWLWQLARTPSRGFCGPEASLARKRCQAEHPAHSMVRKRMDGRSHSPCATGTPLGSIEPLRNLGGMFNMGRPCLGEVVAGSVSSAENALRETLRGAVVADGFLP